jgi:hypothetical protein
MLATRCRALDGRAKLQVRASKWFNANVSAPLATNAADSHGGTRESVRRSNHVFTRRFGDLWNLARAAGERHRLEWTIPVLVSALISTSCSRAAAPPRALHHRLTRPANPDGVFLNEDLVFYFSDDVDRTSVTRDSVRIMASDGTQAHGALSVDDAGVRFTPDPVLAADLSDGGYRPDTQYTVEIRGFPNPDGVRGAHGEPLESTYRWSFRTVRLTTPRTALLFDDVMQDQRPVLRLFPPRNALDSPPLVAPRDSIYLSCNKPLDPSSVRDEDFVLRPLASSGSRVEVRARLIENHPQQAARPRLPAVRSSASAENWERSPRAALIELTPKQALAVGEYLITVGGPRDGEIAGPSDFSGRSALNYLGPLTVRVAEAPLDTGRGVLQEEFLDTRLRSPVAVPGHDGTAHWSDTGRVEVRFPAAAGDGSHGEVELSGNEIRTDIHATRAHLGEGTTAALSSDPGVVVLRCQGRLWIEGDLTRAAPSESRLGFEGSGGTLSDWLALVSAEKRTWTVLVAGGDLVIDGAVRVSTPLLLCAGGVIRVSGTVAAATGQLFLLGEGGGLSIDPSERAKAPLEIDAPISNPLRVPLRLAVLSGPIPPHGEVLRWLGEEVRGSEPGRGTPSGRWSVRYVQELTATAIADERLVPVESPRLFELPGSLQLLITLEVDPAPMTDPRPAWDPPFVDYVRLSWESVR